MNRTKKKGKKMKWTMGELNPDSWTYACGLEISPLSELSRPLDCPN